ncbi:MAG: NAD(P)H-dependent oxidoreductase [Polaromonas sp.]|nr:NAD(P)H-dependent oxidoreductase [Polaromonas sp.]
MVQFKIAVIVGSLRKDSINKKLALALAKLVPADFLFDSLRIDDLPLYYQDDDEQPSEPVKRLKSQIAASQGVLFISPEYNRSIPGQGAFADH